MSYSWFIDYEPVAETKDYSTKLKAGEHIVKLSAKESDERFVELLNKSYDPDDGLNSLLKLLFGISDNLMYEWNVGGQKMSSERDYSLKLSSGEHKIGLKVSDDRKQGYTEKAVTIPEGSGNFAVMQKVIEVDHESLPEYPVRKLNVKVKGISYSAGMPSDPLIEDKRMQESLKVIVDELDCNGIKIYGWNTQTLDFGQRIIKCAEFALEYGFDTICLNSFYYNETIEGTIKRFSRFARNLESLTKKSDNIVLSVGGELTIMSMG
ncbi:MAG: hypothetical protein ACE5K0_07505 [Candidatus Methanofastidiosia archaeon]